MKNNLWKQNVGVNSNFITKKLPCSFEHGSIINFNKANV